ncbi:MAG: S24/S26 family peptidase [Prevotella sp.]|nr:S24/S26 family peptidase [Prevotella sp.]
MKEDYPILQEAIRLVDEGISVTMPADGKSMLPFIVGGKESVIMEKAVKVRRGDVVLAWVDDHRYVIHRILAITDDHVILMGDGNLASREHCLISDIKARVTHVVDNQGHKRFLYTWWRMIGAKCWYLLLPIRRYLLAIYRRI